MPVRIDDEEWKDLRERANNFSAKNKENSRLAKAAYRRNDKKRANILSQKAKSFKQKMNAENMLAAAVIYRRNNEGRSHREIDLHGLYRNEALDYLNQRVADVKKIGLRNLTVIVGKGLHSENGPQLKPAVENYARKKNINFRLNVPNEGCIRFDFDTTPPVSEPTTILPERPINQTRVSEPVRDTTIEINDFDHRSLISSDESVDHESSSSWPSIIGILIIVILLILFLGNLVSPPSKANNSIGSDQDSSSFITDFFKVRLVAHLS